MLRGPLSDNQLRLLQVIYEPFHFSGEWPPWQYADLTMRRRFGADAAGILRSLPRAGEEGPHSYGLTWRADSLSAPPPHTQIGLTVAGLSRVPEARLLVGLFCRLVELMTAALAGLEPDPRKVVTAQITSAAVAGIARADKRIGAEVNDLPPGGVGLAITKRKARRLLEHEPFPFSIHQPDPSAEEWTVEVPAVLHDYQGAATADDYLDRLISRVVPAETPSVPPSPGPLDIPYAIGYLDAVWRSQTQSRLFVNLDPASVGRLTLMCQSEEEFNSLMSALADVLGQAVRPGAGAPPKRGAALENVRDWLVAELEAEPAGRVAAAFATLIRLRHIRVSTQHADARDKAVQAFRDIGLTFPPASWDSAWTHIAAIARSALDVIREEVHAGLGEP